MSSILRVRGDPLGSFPLLDALGACELFSQAERIRLLLICKLLLSSITFRFVDKYNHIKHSNTLQHQKLKN
jgi:hypothetical protein